MSWNRKHLVRGAAVLWMGAISAVMITFHARHTLSFQGIDAQSASNWRAKLKAATAKSPSEKVLFHFLSADCGCSNNVLKALLTRPVSSEWRETVVIVQAPDSKNDFAHELESLERLGYSVVITPDGSQLPTKGVPAVVAFIGERSVYAGGYLNMRVNSASELGLDTFFREIASPGGAKTRPIFGCSVSKYIRQAQKPEEWITLVAEQMVK